MRLIVTGDWHLDAITAGQSRLTEQRLVLWELVERVGEHAKMAGERTVVLFLGDLCNPDKGSRTLAAISEGARVFRAVLDQGATVIAIAGNHDVADNADGLTSLSPLRAALNGLRNGEDNQVFIVEQPRLLTVKDGGAERTFHFMLLPYMAPSCLEKWNQQYSSLSQWVQANVRSSMLVAGHLSIQGAALGSETNDMPRGRENLFPIAESNPARLRFNGHYHKRQNPHDIWCPGSMIRLAFGEEGNPVGWLEWRL